MSRESEWKTALYLEFAHKTKESKLYITDYIYNFCFVDLFVISNLNFIRAIWLLDHICDSTTLTALPVISVIWLHQYDWTLLTAYVITLYLSDITVLPSDVVLETAFSAVLHWYYHIVCICLMQLINLV